MTGISKVRRKNQTQKEASLDFSSLLLNAQNLNPKASIRGGTVKQIFGLENRVDEKIIKLASDVLTGKSKNVLIEMPITNEDRVLCATLSNRISLLFKEKGLPDDSIHIRLKGTGGQSFGAFLARGVTLELCGDANDYVGKGLSGGKIIIYPPVESPFKSVDAIIVGNVVLYGAVSGTLYIRGQAAERFCVRNSGAVAVSEGCGDHGCEYMTGGCAVILGLTGRNFAAGMSGGIAYIYDPTGVFPSKCNKEMVGLHKVKDDEDLIYLKSILTDFHEKTGSEVAKGILDNWPLSTYSFIKVLPFEYERVLEVRKTKKLEVVPKPAPVESESKVADIEDSGKNLDKLRGFHKYERNNEPYRKPEVRINDWNEIFNHGEVRKGLRKQAARCMDCGIPFCQSKDGCPLGNIIPKWNDLVFQGNWRDAL